MDYIHGINVGNVTYGVGLPNFYINDKGNLNIETSTSIGNTPSNKGKINIEANSDILFKPGDDIILYSHHRAEGKQNEVAIKMTDGDDNPVKTQINTSEINLTTKLKDGTNGGDMNIEVNCNTDTRGYLKVRAQAIDLRCEKHGGIALQPKGYDGDGNMNKIKFEHGGGDGLEFGTFNSEKTSIFTDEYRFNKDGVWKMATRLTTPSGKTIRDEGSVPVGKPNTADLKYVKQADDFYDIIAQDDEQCTTKDIIKTASALNGQENVHTKITSKGNLEIGTNHKWYIGQYTALTTAKHEGYVIEVVDTVNPETDILYPNTKYNIDFSALNQASGTLNVHDALDLALQLNWSTLLVGAIDAAQDAKSAIFGASSQASGDIEHYVRVTYYPELTDSESVFYTFDTTLVLPYSTEKTYTFDEIVEMLFSVHTSAWTASGVTTNTETLKGLLLDSSNKAKTIYLCVSSQQTGATEGYYLLKRVAENAPKINIESDNEIELTSKGKISLEGEEINLKGILDFGSTFNFGETDNGIEVQYKLTKKNATKDCGVIKVVGFNNHASNDLTVEGVTIAPGQTDVIAQCSLLDVIKLVNYMKTNNEGPWASQL